MRAKKYWLMAIAGLAFAALVGVALWYPGTESNPYAGNPAERLAAGKAVYDAHCAACHGADLEGQAKWRERQPNCRLPAPPHDASGHTWHHDDDMLFALTKQGPEPFAPPGYQSNMPDYGATLTDAEIYALLAYIRSTWPGRRRSPSGRAKAVEALVMRGDEAP